MSVRSVTALNEALVQLWRTSDPKLTKRVPILYSAGEKELLFVGLNPSFSESGWTSVVKDSPFTPVDVKELLRWRPHEIDVARVLELEELAVERYSFFNRHREIARELNKTWGHLDVFAWRSTKQRAVTELAFESPPSLRLGPFWQSRFDLFLDLLRLRRPCVVVFVNKLATEIFWHQQGDAIRFVPEMGWHEMQLAEDGPAARMSFSGMLSGQRALDTFSRDRLYWHIARAFETDWPHSRFAGRDREQAG